MFLFFYQPDFWLDLLYFLILKNTHQGACWPAGKPK